MNYDDDEKSIFFTPPNANNQLFIHTLIVSSENSYIRPLNERHSLSSRRVVNEIYNVLISVHFLWHYG